MTLCDWLTVPGLWRRIRDLDRDLDDLRASYQATVVALHDAMERETALAADLADTQFHLECVSVDNADLERVNEALRGGLQFFDPSKGRGR